MKNLLIALLFVCGFACAGDAKFKIGETTFVYTVREGSITYDLVVLDADADIYQGWTDSYPNEMSIIVADFNDDIIMAHGGRRQFIDWGLGEAMRRAQAHMDHLKPPVPDQSNKMENTVWQIRYNLSSFPIVIPPAPLP